MDCFAPLISSSQGSVSGAADSSSDRPFGVSKPPRLGTIGLCGGGFRPFVGPCGICAVEGYFQKTAATTWKHPSRPLRFTSRSQMIASAAVHIGVDLDEAGGRVREPGFSQTRSDVSPNCLNVREPFESALGYLSVAGLRFQDGSFPVF